VALTAVFVLAPSTRFGYFLYPLVLAAWAVIWRAGEPSVDDELDALLREGVGERIAGEVGAGEVGAAALVP
jgi:hypothetical protein